jgi:hypothetical protein
MSTTVRPDNLRAALDAKLAAAMSQLAELREVEQPRITVHLHPREIVETFLSYVCRVQPIADAFGREHAGDLQFDVWYAQWLEKLGEADRTLWKQLREEHVRRDLGLGTALTEVEISVPSDPSVTVDQPAARTRAAVPKQLVRFAASPNRPASDVCADYLRVARRFVHDFLRDYAKFLR